MGTAARSEDQSSPEDREARDAAHRRLFDRVVVYQEVTGPGLKPGEFAPCDDPRPFARAQADVAAAEREVWRLRERCLGWSRPSWAPGAALLADWFSEDDTIYDDITPAPTR